MEHLQSADFKQQIFNNAISILGLVAQPFDSKSRDLVVSS
jgi:hypothetical protein